MRWKIEQLLDRLDAGTASEILADLEAFQNKPIFTLIKNAIAMELQDAKTEARQCMGTTDTDTVISGAKAARTWDIFELLSEEGLGFVEPLAERLRRH